MAKSINIQSSGDIVSLYNKGGKIGLNFRFNGKRKQFSLGLSYNDDNLEIAYQKAAELETDIIYNRFDGNVDKYKIKGNSNLQLVTSKVVELRPKTAFDLKDCWTLYKKHKQATIVKSKQKKWWPVMDKMIVLLEEQNLLSINQASEALEFLLETYSYGTLLNHFKDFRAATNLAIDLGKYEGKNYYATVLKLFPSPDKKDPEAFTQEEIVAIIDAFKSNRYSSKYSSFKSDYYAPFIEFRFMTGCRPSEAIALTWDDIKYEKGKAWIEFTKAYVDGELQDKTKIKENRKFPIYPQVKRFLDDLPRIPNQYNLIFPSIKDKGYIHSSNFSRDYWLRIVRDGLFKESLISKYLPFKDERHTCITNMVQAGLDLGTIAKIVGNSPQTIERHYLAGKNDLSDLPDLF